MLVSGVVDIIVNGRKVMSKSSSGQDGIELFSRRGRAPQRAVP